MGRICVCGHFAFGKNKLNGQTVKTKITASALEEFYGRDKLMYIDTAGLPCLLLLLPRLIKAAALCNHIIILPAYKGLRVVVPILAFLRIFFSFKTHHLLIGGWLANFLEGKPFLEKCYSSVVTYIYAETTVSCQALRDRGYVQAMVLPNYKQLRISDPSDLPQINAEKGLKVCTFSRVMKRKGIEDAVNAVCKANEILGREVYTLSIYGQVEPGEEAWFETLKQNLPSCANYGGMIPFDESTNVLKNYFALLFPTQFYTEGVPGTIIDAYASGLPVISARWQSFSDVVDEGETGYGYPLGDTTALIDLLVDFAKEPEKILSLRPHCIERAKGFLPQNAMPKLLERLK